MAEMIEITKERYDELKDLLDWHNALEIAGVDNWEGYDTAREILLDIQNGVI